MATLKYAKSCRLPPPKFPTRTVIQNTADALHTLGFDAKFDLDLEREADAIRESELKLEKRLDAALQYAQARAYIVSLPCAYVELTKPIREGAELLDPPADECYVSVAEKIAAACAQHFVQASDVEVEPQDDQVRCSIHIHGGDWVYAVLETLASVTKDKGGGLDRGDPSGIHRALAAVHCTEDLKLTVTPRWALDRVGAGLRLLNEECGRQLDMPNRREELLKHVEASRKAYEEVWVEFFHEEKQDVDALQQKPPMSCFGGQLLPVVEGLNRGLRQDQVRMQDASELPDLMADAARAHQQLKEALAPRTAWATSSFNDLYEVPYDDERRAWIGGSGCVAPGGVHFDPGIKVERHVFEKAKCSQRPEQVSPPVKYLVDISRLSITFDTLKDVCTGFERILANMDVVWVENGFLNPTCLGYRCFSVGVRQVVDTRAHICTLKLHLKALEDVRKEAGNQCYQEIRGMLQSCGIKPQKLGPAQRVLLQELGCTRRQNCRSRELDFLQVRDAAEEILEDDDISEEGRQLLSTVLYEVSEAAMTAGVPAEWVRVFEEHELTGES